MSALKVRLATNADAGMLAALNWDVQHLHAAERPDIFKQPGDLGVIAEDLRVRFLDEPDSCILLVEVDGVAVGYAAVNIMRRPETPYSYARQHVHVDQIAVKPSAQRHGCGRALIEAVRDLARTQNMTRVTLDTWDFNVNAQAFFKQMGFSPYHYRMEAQV